MCGSEVWRLQKSCSSPGMGGGLAGGQVPGPVLPAGQQLRAHYVYVSSYHFKVFRGLQSDQCDLCSLCETVHTPSPISQPLARAPCSCGAAFRVCTGPRQPPAMVSSQLSRTFCQHPECSLPLTFTGTEVMAGTGRGHVRTGPPSGSPESALGLTPSIATLDVSGDKESSPFPSLPSFLPDQ